MKLQSLEIEGFGPFKNKQTVDFSKFADDGLFLIEGETGSGKSSILDAITFALYNFTARWLDSNANAEFKSVRSHFCEPDEPTRVQLIFELLVGEQKHTYRIVRSIPGLKKDGAEKPVVVDLFEVFNDGSEQGLASGVSSVASEVTKLVRLDKTEFLQVVLLAQGRFQAFLEATSDQRLELLRKLFDTSRFAEIQRSLADKASQIEVQIRESRLDLASELKTLSESLGIEAPAPGDEVAWIASLLEQANKLRADIDTQAQAAKKHSDEAIERVQQAKDQAELRDLKSQKALIEAGRKTHEGDKSKLKLGQKAARVSGLRVVLNAAENSLTLAQAELEAIPSDRKLPRDLDSLRPLIKTQAALKGQLAPLVEEEESMAKSLQRLEELKSQLAGLEASLDKHKAEIQLLKVEREEVSKNLGDIEALRLAKSAAEAAQSEFVAFQSQRVASEQAKIKAHDALEALERATENQQILTHSYRANLAYSLAKDLEPGEACLVCGSTDHPAQAKSQGAAVTDDELNAANEARSKAASDEGAAKTALESLEKTLEPLAIKFDGLSEESVNKSKTKANEAFAKASAAVARIDEITRLLDPEGELNVELTSLTQGVTVKATEIKNADSAIKKLKDKLSKNLGGFASVAEHFGSVEKSLEKLLELSDALSEVATKRDSRDQAADFFKQKLESEGFASGSAFEKAFLEPHELEQLEEDVQVFDDNAKRLETLLADVKFKTLPTIELDLSEAQATAESASELRTQIEREQGAATEKAKQIQSCQMRVAKILPKIERFAADQVVHTGLANIVNGKEPNTLRISLEAYFAAAELEVILEAANSHLKSMAAGSKYTLKHSDRALKGAGKTGLGIELMDEDTGRDRQPETLSGGEKFQVSLAIALGLAQVVSDRSGAIRVDTLFVDEGFGSLSSSVLETAMRTLDSLKQGGRTIGLISHVEKMQEEISAKLLVEKTPRGPSLIRQS